MVFAKRLRERVRHGEITCTVRIWMRPHVRVGGRYRMEGGEIEVNSIETIGCPAITPELARKSRFRGPGSAQVGGAGQRREHLLNPLPLRVAASRQGQSNSSKEQAMSQNRLGARPTQHRDSGREVKIASRVNPMVRALYPIR